ncbi:MAG: hypothetical protein MJ181_06665 [Treponema sp.]|nr:hypothetical protein [Treponema sp.]
MSDQNEPNFIFPRTETTVYEILGEIQKKIDTTRILMGAIYLAYLILRTIFFSKSLVLNLIILALFVAQYVFLILNIFSRFDFYRIRKSLRRIKYIPSSMMIIVIVSDCLSNAVELLPLQYIMIVVMSVGIILLALGDLILEFIPGYFDRIMKSFKEDTELRGIASRGAAKLEQEIKEGLGISDTRLKNNWLIKLLHKKKDPEPKLIPGPTNQD